MSDETREWQIAEGSLTAHVIDTAKPAWKNPDGSRRRSGPRALCGRYPQRNAEFPWWTWSVTETDALTGVRHYHRRACPDCQEALDA